MSLKLKILGSGSAMPTPERNTTSQLLKTDKEYFLIDCGEATQHQLMKFKCKMSKIRYIFISHLHGDHFFGLAGLLSSFRLLKREKELDIFGPAGLEKSIEQLLQTSKINLPFELNYHELSSDKKNKILITEHLKVFSFPLQHRLPTTGFLFQEKEMPANIKKSFVKNHDIPIDEFKKIKAGNDFVDEEGITHKFSDITIQAKQPKSFAYCSDTGFNKDLEKYFNNVDLLYHEATFLNKNEELANEKMHSTAKQAAIIADITNSKNLLLGHFSNRNKDVEKYRKEAKEIFANVELAYDGKEIDLYEI